MAWASEQWMTLKWTWTHYKRDNMTQLSLGKQFTHPLTLTHSYPSATTHTHAHTHTHTLTHRHVATLTLLRTIAQMHLIIRTQSWAMSSGCAREWGNVCICAWEVCACMCVCVCERERERERERGDTARLKFRHIFQSKDSNYLYQWMIENEEISSEQEEEDPVLRNLPKLLMKKSANKINLKTVFLQLFKLD